MAPTIQGRSTVLRAATDGLMKAVASTGMGARGWTVSSACGVLALGLSLAAPAGALAQGKTITATIDKAGGSGPGAGLTGVACVSTTECVGVDAMGGEVVFNPRHPAGASRFEVTSSYALIAVSCVSATQCVTTGSQNQGLQPIADLFYFDPATGEGTALDLNGGAPTALSCLALYCTEVADDGSFNHLDPDGAYSFAPIDSNLLGGVSCWASESCTAVDSAGNALTFDTTPGGDPTKSVKHEGVVDSAGSMTGVACPSATQCTGIDIGPGRTSGGGEVTFNPQSGGAGSARVGIVWGEALLAVACPSTSQCTAVGGTNTSSGPGVEVTFDPAQPQRAVFRSLAGTHSLQAVACPSVSQCTAVGVDGQEATFDPRQPRAPIAVNSRRVRVRGGVAKVSLACAWGADIGVCRGKVTISAAGKRLGTASYLVDVGASRVIAISITRRVHGRLRGTVSVSLSGAGRLSGSGRRSGAATYRQRVTISD